MGAAGFDVLAYAADAHGSHRAELAGVGEPLPEDLRGLLRYLQRRFAGTTTWLSLVLVTPTHKEARITAFLSAWAYERHWLADAVAALLGEPAAPPAPRSRWEGLRDRLAPLAESVVANVHGSALTAVQMADRVVDGLVVDRLLAVAADGAPASVATDLGRIRGVLARQQAFFAETAADRLAGSPRAQRLARSRLTAAAWPIGADRDPAGTAAAFAALTASDPRWAAHLDEEVDALPGLAGLRLLQRSAANPGRPVLRTPLRAAAALGRLAASVTDRKG